MPATTAASQRPAAIARCAIANTLALDEHAVDTVADTPATPSTSRRKRSGAAMLWR